MSNLNGATADMGPGHLTFNTENLSSPDSHEVSLKVFGYLCNVKGSGAKCTSPEAALRCIMKNSKDHYNKFLVEMQTDGVKFALSPIQDGEGLLGKRATLTGSPLSDSDKPSIIFETEDPNCMDNLAGKTGYIDSKTNIVFE